jgi:hypothetical protein
MGQLPPSYTTQGIKPGKVQAISIMMLVNGILNILYGLGATAAIVLGTLGIGLLCSPITILPSVLGVFEIITANKLLSNPPRNPSNIQVIAILEVAAIISGDVVSMVVGILNLIFLNDLEVKNYLSGLPA